MDTIIVYRINGGKVQVVINDDEEITVFPHQDEAVRYTDTNRLFQSGQSDFQIVSLDEI
jgi:hypothetical protein